jgi:hypothetical protein
MAQLGVAKASTTIVGSATNVAGQSASSTQAEAS